VLDAARDWYRSHTSRSTDYTVDALLAAKDATVISVVIPARNEAETVGEVVGQIRASLMDGVGLIDELIVMDSDSTDATARIAADHGAEVHATRSVNPVAGTRPGKGEALWKSLFVSRGDLLVFIDADLTEWGPHFVTGLLGPLLLTPEVRLVKGFYDRLLEDGTTDHSPQGGRVTELVARPLLNRRWPELAAVVQPLAGEWAARRELMAALSIPTGYGVELATLIDTLDRYGLPAIAQVDLGSRGHRHQSVHDLGVMAAEIQYVADRRYWPRLDLPRPDGVDDAAPGVLSQFDRTVPGNWLERPVPLAERPPAAASPQYRAART
jgi:glucosyl-3-phosphoglycerate synthase